MISHYIAVGIGGAIGSIARVFLSKLLPVSVSGIPLQILLVNVIGCFLIGLLAEVMALYWPVSENVRYFLISGLLGGFTTFSAFALEFGLLIEKNNYIEAFLYAILSFGLSIGFFFLGLKLVRYI